MSLQLLIIGFLTLASFFAYGISVSPLSALTPQLIALFSLGLVSYSLFKKRLPLIFIAFIVNLIVFSTNGLGSPFFFLIYFLLFIIAFTHPPSTTLSYSLMLIIFLSQSLNGPTAIIPLISLLFITPLAYFVGQQYLETIRQSRTIANEETDILLWLNLKFKTGITHIIDHASELLSQPQLTLTQKEAAREIKDSAHSLLNSANKLTKEIGDDNPDI